MNHGAIDAWQPAAWCDCCFEGLLGMVSLIPRQLACMLFWGLLKPSWKGNCLSRCSELWVGGSSCSGKSSLKTCSNVAKHVLVCSEPSLLPVSFNLHCCTFLS